MLPPGLEIPDRLNVSSWLLDRHLDEGRGDRIAIIDAADGSRHSYADVAVHASRVGNALRQLGIDLEQRVMLLLHDGPDFVASFLGAIRIGAIPVPANTMLKGEDYAYLLNDSRARALVVSAPLLPAIAPILGQLRYLRHLLISGDCTAAPKVPGSIAVHSLSELAEAASPELDPEPMSADDPAFWLYSSGTTGFPKGAVHLQHDILVSAHAFGHHVIDIDPDDISFSVGKLFFAYGLGNSLYVPFSVGAASILYPGRPDPASVFEVIGRYQPTLLYSVPTGYGAMLAHDDAPDRDALATLRACVSAGEALPPALYERWLERYGLEILDGIGSTEILHIFIANRPGSARPGSSGQMVPGYEARVVDEYGHDVATGEVGDLLVRGDSTCAYYWNKHEATKSTLQGEWIRTGDKYRVDEDAYYWYQGRSDDMLKVSGIWVSPFEVEAALMQHPDVLEAAVVGDRDTDGLVKPRAFVVANDGSEPNEELAAALKLFVKATIAPYKYPRWIEFVDELPRTATGKIQRYRLR